MQTGALERAQPPSRPHCRDSRDNRAQIEGPLGAYQRESTLAGLTFAATIMTTITGREVTPTIGNYMDNSGI